ncbi:MAG TPA: hypothetical protein ENI42_06570 [Thermoplasmatales archaeon]|nr:hypothetical protein [Thermoplasmatales archaeon]
MSLTPKEITPVDDAFHGSKKHVAVEWWYFDAVFNNGYSVHVGVKTFSRKKFGLVSPMIEVYRHGHLEAKAARFHPFSRFKTSLEKPFLMISGEPVVLFDEERFRKKGEWVYRVSMNVSDCMVDLCFSGLSQGWKIETSRESWTVSLPKSFVEGVIGFNGKKLEVKGVGYHDHNWNYTLLTVMNYGRGWYWGRVNGKKFTVVWANILRKNRVWEPLAVVNLEKNGFIPVNPDCVSFESEGFVYMHHRKTPTRFRLKVDDKTGDVPVEMDIVMDVQTVHYDSVAVFLPYFRYHVETKGFIMVGSDKEKLDGVQIMESLSFG